MEVSVVALDKVFSRGQKISVIKLDLEGFELQALRRMETLPNERRIRAIVFEEINPHRA